MAFPTEKLIQVMAKTFPETRKLLDLPRHSKLNIGSGGVEHGVDPGFTNLDSGYAPEQAGEDKHGILRVIGDAQNLDKAFGLVRTWDVIYTHHLLEHIPYQDAPRVLKSWVDRIDDGGVLYICVPDARWAVATASEDQQWQQVLPEERRWQGHVDEPFDWNLAQFVLYAGGDHRSAWWPEALRAAMLNAGLKDVKEWQANRVHDPNWLPSCECTMIGVK